MSICLGVHQLLVATAAHGQPDAEGFASALEALVSQLEAEHGPRSTAASYAEIMGHKVSRPGFYL